MTSITKTPQWQTLQQQQDILLGYHLRDLFAQDPLRFQHFSLSAAGLLLDFSKNRLTAETITLLCQLAQAARVPEKIELLFTGHPVNTTENRAALHTALRQQNDTPIFVNGKNIIPEIRDVEQRMESITQAILQQKWRGYSGKAITDVVNIGIGGSALGPAMVASALKPYANSQLRCHFVSNIDGSHIQETLRTLNPETTFFIISSKTFTTQETLYNGRSARKWLMRSAPNDKAIHNHFLAVTAQPRRAAEFGIPEENILPIWDWVGGRFSLWSAVGLPIALSVGYDNFRQLLRGAAAMDEHFRTAPLSQNMPIMLALLSIWYTNFWGAAAHAVLPYEENLHLLPSYLQQAQMESLGKQVKQDGAAVDYTTGMIIWGGVGTNGQHAFHQLLHQGTRFLLTDFILTARSHYELDDHHAALFANGLSQSKALMFGKTAEETYDELLQQGVAEETAKKLLSHKIMSGNRPSNTIVLPQLTPYYLGALIALYEHKIFTQSVIWDINCFDQWGVELGKAMSLEILDDLEGVQDSVQDASTRGLINYFKARQPKTEEVA